MQINFYESNEGIQFDRVFILSKYNGKWAFAKYKGIDTISVPSGPVMKNEALNDAVVRLMEKECGAVEYVYEPVLPFSFDEGGELIYGMLYYADITHAKRKLYNSIEKMQYYKLLPDNWTDPVLDPRLVEEYLRQQLKKANIIL